MINTPASARPPPPQPAPGPSQTYSSPGRPGLPTLKRRTDYTAYGHDRDHYTYQQPSNVQSLDEQYPAAATAAVALAQLHNHRPDSDWESEAVRWMPQSGSRLIFR